MATKDDLLGILESSGYPDAKGDDSLVENLGMDSLEIAQFIQDVEDVLDVEIDDSEIDDTTTVNDLFALIEARADQ